MRSPLQLILLAGIMIGIGMLLMWVLIALLNEAALKALALSGLLLFGLGFLTLAALHGVLRQPFRVMAWAAVAIGLVLLLTTPWSEVLSLAKASDPAPPIAQHSTQPLPFSKPQSPRTGWQMLVYGATRTDYTRFKLPIIMIWVLFMVLLNAVLAVKVSQSRVSPSAWIIKNLWSVGFLIIMSLIVAQWPVIR